MNIKAILTATCMLIMPIKAIAYISDSSGADGAFNPVVDTQLTLPPSGIFNFTDVTIPAGVTVTFTKNAANTGVIMLATGNITIDGTINLNGADGEPEGGGTSSRGPAGGIGGPGGFAGGRGGLITLSGKILGERGFGPGAGAGGGNNQSSADGGSAGHATPASANAGFFNRGGTYGSSLIRIPLGGSGGGGGRGHSVNAGGGGGGGGAIILAATGTITVNGTITALGGALGTRSVAFAGGAGSGGAVRIVATTIAGNGPIIAYGGLARDSRAGTGRIRLEADNYARTATTNPANSAGLPQPILYTNTPSIKITSVAGVPVPANPTGYRDLTIPGTTTAPVSVAFETSNIPLGTTITLIADGEHTVDKSATSTAITGSVALGTASADIELTEANVRLYGRVIYTLTLAGNPNAAAYAKYAKNEAVEKVRYSVNSDGLSEATLITASGKEYTWPTNAINIH